MGCPFPTLVLNPVPPYTAPLIQILPSDVGAFLPHSCPFCYSFLPPHQNGQHLPPLRAQPLLSSLAFYYPPCPHHTDFLPRLLVGFHLKHQSRHLFVQLFPHLTRIECDHNLVRRSPSIIIDRCYIVCVITSGQLLQPNVSVVFVSLCI